MSADFLSIWTAITILFAVSTSGPGRVRSPSRSRSCMGLDTDLGPHLGINAPARPAANQQTTPPAPRLLASTRHCEPTARNRYSRFG
ncbi:hypothetical protein EVAR_20127_1 [Eumeta japonica]|uniref:Secreted protein n=1 Tax=Eumeta variegata TaxID=151549 RepID=A0A4C1V3T0_EUMVA|nr:hypothetical protein EVAR_20127_1 [Eumeta japonica]